MNPALLLLYLGKEGVIILTRGKSYLVEVFYQDQFRSISSDPIVGTDQAWIQFWVCITTEYNKMCGIVNNQKKDEQGIGMTKYVDRSLVSLKSRWTQKILPAVNKF
jgi:hypothetical protein